MHSRHVKEKRSNHARLLYVFFTIMSQTLDRPLDAVEVDVETWLVALRPAISQALAEHSTASAVHLKAYINWPMFAMLVNAPAKLFESRHAAPARSHSGHSPTSMPLLSKH